MKQGHLKESFHEVSLEYGNSGLGHFPGGLGLGFSDGTGRSFLAEDGQRLGNSEGDIAFPRSLGSSGGEAEASSPESWIGPLPRGFGLGLGSTRTQFQGLQAGVTVRDGFGQLVDGQRRDDLGTAVPGHQKADDPTADSVRKSEKERRRIHGLNQWEIWNRTEALDAFLVLGSTVRGFQKRGIPSAA
jgi:hypothetical protein